MPTHILMGPPQLLRQSITGATVVFLDKLGYLFSCINCIDNGLLLRIDIQRLLLDAFDLGAFFCSMPNLTTSPPTRSKTSIWWRIQFSIRYDINNQPYNISAPPRLMICLDIIASVPCPLPLAARRYTRKGFGLGTIGYHLHGYIGNLTLSSHTSGQGKT